MIKLVDHVQQSSCILKDRQHRGAQNWLTEYPSGVTARYFEERI